MRKIGTVLFLVLFALVWMVPCYFMGQNISEHFEYKNLLRNGVETEAIIIVGTASSTSTVNGVPNYSIEYFFYDNDGQKCYGKTSESYTKTEISKLQQDGIILVKYNPENKKSVEASYKLGHNISLIIFSIVIIGVDAIIWGIAIYNIVKIIHRIVILKNGDEYIATFITSSSLVRVNHIPMYYIKYSWIDDRGEKKEAKSDHEYTYHEAKAYEAAGNFKIRVKNGKSVIVSKPSEIIIVKNKEVDKPKKAGKCVCSYCGTTYKKDEKRCPSCGAVK